MPVFTLVELGNMYCSILEDQGVVQTEAEIPYKHTNNYVFDECPKIFRKFPKISEDNRRFPRKNR